MDPKLLPHPDFWIFLCAFLILLVIYVSVMSFCWGTLSLSQVKLDFKARQALERRYEATLQRREDMLYHIGCARQGGEYKQAALLEKQLGRVDNDLDLLEESLRELDARHSGKKPKLKL